MELDLERRQTSEYGELKRRVREAGLLKPQPWYYTGKIITVFGMLAAGVVIALVIHNPWLLLLDAVFLGFVSTQQGLLAHDVA
ncbi:MAG: acyl-CoA desaturase, partial [Tepidiformaceae bacterium]